MPKRNAKRSTVKKRTNHQATEQTATNHAARADQAATGRTANTHSGTTLVTHAVGAIPILQRLLRRMRLHDFLPQHLPPEDKRTTVATPRVLLLLLNNLLVSREPVEGVAEWAREFDPPLFDLPPQHIKQLHDDRVGRCLDRLARTLNTNLIRDVVSVADCKLATTEPLCDIASRGGRFIPVLPATRKENATFRSRLVEQPESIKCSVLYHQVEEDGNLEDALQGSADEHATKEGFRLLWSPSLRKQASDAAARATRLERAINDLTTRGERLAGPRTRFRVREKVVAAVDAILDE